MFQLRFRGWGYLSKHLSFDVFRSFRRCAQRTVSCASNTHFQNQHLPELRVTGVFRRPLPVVIDEGRVTLWAYKDKGLFTYTYKHTQIHLTFFLGL